MAGYPSDWNSRRREVYRRDNYECQNCSRKGGPRGDTELHAHHVVPKSKGGTHKKSNLLTVCKGCHDAIHGRRRAPAPTSKSVHLGSVTGHLLVFIIFGWWTFGLANILYAVVSYSASKDRHELENVAMTEIEVTDGSDGSVESTGSPGGETRPRLGKSESEGWAQKSVDERQNKRHDGCPSCEERSLTVSWIRVDDGKVKIHECEDCGAMFDERDENGETYLKQIDSPDELSPVKSAVWSELFG